MLLVLAPPYPAIAQTEEIDKKTLRDQRRQERKQQREIRREERLKEKNQSGSTPAPTAIQATDESDQKVIRKQPQSEPQEETYQEEPSKNKSQSGNTPEPATTPPAGASNKTNTQKKQTHAQPVTHQETSPTRSSESTIETASAESESNLLKPLLIWGILLYLVYHILRWTFSRRCKKCGKFRAMTTIDESYLGRVKTERSQNGGYVHSNRIKFTRQCKYCGHQDHIIKTVKEKN